MIVHDSWWSNRQVLTIVDYHQLSMTIMHHLTRTLDLSYKEGETHTYKHNFIYTRRSGAY